MVDIWQALSIFMSQLDSPFLFSMLMFPPFPKVPSSLDRQAKLQRSPPPPPTRIICSDVDHSGESGTLSSTWTFHFPLFRWAATTRTTELLPSCSLDTCRLKFLLLVLSLTRPNADRVRSLPLTANQHAIPQISAPRPPCWGGIRRHSCFPAVVDSVSPFYNTLKTSGRLQSLFADEEPRCSSGLLYLASLQTRYGRTIGRLTSCTRHHTLTVYAASLPSSSASATTQRTTMEL